ncbi:MAG: SRPBCC family protein [Reyranellales bacterium]
MTDYGSVISPTEVRFQRLLPGPIETLWAYLADPKKRGEWFASGPTDLRVGGKMVLRFKHSDLSPHKAPPPEKYCEIDAKGHEFTVEITECDSPRRLAFTWPPSSEVVFELAPQGDKVLFTLTHRRLGGRDEMVNVCGGWHALLVVMVERANGRAPQAFWDIHRSIEGQYEKRIPR